MSITGYLKKSMFSRVRLSSSARAFHVLVDLMNDFWSVVVLELGMINVIILALLDDLVGLVTRISGRL